MNKFLLLSGHLMIVCTLGLGFGLLNHEKNEDRNPASIESSYNTASHWEIKSMLKAN